MGDGERKLNGFEDRKDMEKTIWIPQQQLLVGNNAFTIYL